MRRRSFFAAIFSFFAAIAGYRFWRGTTPAVAQDKGMMGGAMMGGGGMGEMMSPENMRGPMRTGMALFERHKLIHCTVAKRGALRNHIYRSHHSGTHPEACGGDV